MTCEEFISKLEGVQESGGGWVARCPAHDDDSPSLSVSRGSDGRVLVHCHAGCSAEQICDSLGLKLADLMPAKPIKPSGGGKLGQWVCDYVYTDEAGKVLYKSCRYVKDGKKTFIIKTPNPSAKWGWDFGLKEKHINRVPYHLPRIVRATAAGKGVVIVEGEKDVETVERVIGCAATCNVAGAMKWGLDFPEGWVKWFLGARSITIIADNDAATKTVRRRVKGRVVEEERVHLRGQKHAADVRRQLVAAGYQGRIRLVVMPQVDGQKHVKDFTDWVEARQAAGLPADRSAALEAINAAPAWPDEWNFDGKAIEAEIAELAKEKREPKGAAAGEKRAGEGGESGMDGAAQDNGGREDSLGALAGKHGRFGCEVPRSPGAVREYAVDYDLGTGKKNANCGVVFQYGWSVEEIRSHLMARMFEKVTSSDLPKNYVPRAKAWSAAIWLLMRGSFFWHKDYRDFSTCMFLDRDEASCRLMRVMSDEFFAFVGKAARLEDVDPKKGDMGKILGLIKQIAVDPAYSRGVSPSNSWDRRGDVVYISSGDTEMVRIDRTGARMVQNGTDGVVFLRGKTLAPWKLQDGPGIDPFATAALFQGASFADKHGLMNVRLWTLNLFASHATKPPMLITGGAGSGKTRMAKGIKEILGMRQDGALDLSVQQIEDGDKGLDAFWATVNDGKLEVFDNFDTKVKWASDTLQNAATDGQTKRRTLYTTFGVSILRANASLILTSNNPVFSTEGNGGLADRLITIPLSFNRSSSKDAELSSEIAANRDQYMTWFVRTISKVLADDLPVDASVNRRHPDYGVFSVKVGRACGDEQGALDALGSAEADKALLPLKNDVVAHEILAVLASLGWNWTGTAGEMSEKIIDRQGDDPDEKTKQIFSARRVGKAFNRYLRQFSIIFSMAEPKILQGRSQYAFSGLTLLGRAVVGLVDLNGDFGKTCADVCAHGFTGNGDSNPPNPPTGSDARAGAGGVYSFREEEEGEEEWGLNL